MGVEMNYRAAAEQLTSGKDITVATEEDARKVSGELYRIEKEHRKNFHPIGKLRILDKNGKT
jgi:hypothetical protein